MNLREEPLLFELSSPGRVCASLPDCDVPATLVPPELARSELGLPEIDELSLVRHFTRLSQKNFSIDTQFYPLGSCTMKYNPKANEQAASLPGWRNIHPLSGEEFNQGALELIHSLQAWLCEIGGFAARQPPAGCGRPGRARGRICIIRAYHAARADGKRRVILVPDSAHGTNPAILRMAGFEAVTIPSDADGGVDMAALALAAAGRCRRRHHDHQPEHPRPLRAQHRGDRRVSCTKPAAWSTATAPT